MVVGTRFVRSLALAGLAAAALSLLGCGSDRPKLAIVRGTVTYKGKPVPYGNVNFVPKAGPPATGEIGPDGSYTLTTFQSGDGAVLGPHKVVIIAIDKQIGKEARDPLPPPIIPAKYTSIAMTDLQADVHEGENTCDFMLEDPKKK